MTFLDIFNIYHHPFVCKNDSCICESMLKNLGETLYEKFKYLVFTYKSKQQIETYIKSWLMLFINNFEENRWSITPSLSNEVTLTFDIKEHCSVVDILNDNKAFNILKETVKNNK